MRKALLGFSLLLLVGCGRNSTSTLSSLASDKCSGAVPISVGLVNLPAGVAPTEIAMTVVDELGHVQALKPVTVTSEYVGFQGDGDTSHQYTGFIYLRGELYSKKVSIGFDGYTGCNFNSNFDFATGEAATGL